MICINGERVWNLAGTALDDDVTVLTDGAGLLRVSLGGSGVGLRLEMVLLVGHRSQLRRRPIQFTNKKTQEHRTAPHH